VSFDRRLPHYQKQKTSDRICKCSLVAFNEQFRKQGANAHLGNNHDMNWEQGAKPLYLVDFPALRRHIAAGGCCWRQLQVSERIGCLPRSTDVGDRDKRMYYFIQCVFCCFVAYYFIQLQFVNLNLFGTQCCVRNLRSLPMTAIENQMPEAVLLCCGH
jgi:hypothetical protein